MLIGKTCFFKFRMLMASSTVFGSGLYSWSLPMMGVNDLFQVLGAAMVIDSGTIFLTGTVRRSAPDRFGIVFDNTWNYMSAEYPFVVADNDEIWAEGAYEIP